MTEATQQQQQQQIIKVRGQEKPGVTGKFGLGVQNEAGKSLIEFCQENALVIANTLFQKQLRTRHGTRLVPKREKSTSRLCIVTLLI